MTTGNPYPNGTDSYWLWKWSEAVKALIATENTYAFATRQVSIRPRNESIDAMTRIELERPEIGQLLKESVLAAEEALEQFAVYNPSNRLNLEHQMDVLSRRIKVAAQFVAESQNTKAGEINNSDGLPEIKIDEKLLQARYDGTVYELTDAQAIGLQAVIQAKGDWVSWSKIGISKPSAVKKGLPAPLQDLLESEPGKGCRLKRTR